MIAGLAALSLTASVFATTEPAAAGYWKQGQGFTWVEPSQPWTHITLHYVWPHQSSNCYYDYRYAYDMYGNYVPRYQYIC